VFLASPVVPAGDATGDTEIVKCFDMNVVLVPADGALSGIGTAITCGVPKVCLACELRRWPGQQ
jgi:hypothetical protein